MIKYPFLFSCVVLFTITAYAQKKIINDTNYYETFPNKLTTRVYLSQKFLKFTIPSSSQTDIEYKANTKMNMGFGVTYRNFSANFFYGFAFLNKDSAKGTTKGLDLQLHFYPRRWAIDLLAIFPKGYHIGPIGYASTSPDKYYYRPDVKVRLLGLSAYQVLNKERFSYRAAITQNEWQKKSAGSFLYGGMINYGRVTGDSALVPKSIENGFSQKGIDDLRFMAVGLGGGYAHTFVIHKHFFITASAIANLDLTFSKTDGEYGKANRTSLGQSVIAKGALGYNSPTWNVSLNGLGSALWAKGNDTGKMYYMPLGTLRLVVSRKINLKKKEKHQ